MRLSTLLIPDIAKLLEEDPDAVRQLLDDLHPEDAADIVGELPPDQAAALFARLTAPEAAPIFERLDRQEQEDVVEQMPPESVAGIAREMAADDRADLFGLLPDAVGDQLLAELQKVDPEAAQEVRDIERWPETSAGHLMTTDFVTASPSMQVSAVVDLVKSRAREHEEFVYVVYVVDDGRRLLGVISVRELWIADADRRVEEVMREAISVPPALDQEEVARRMAKYDLNAMPVVGDGGRLLGIITIDDVVDVLVAEQTEDVQKIGGVEPLDVPYFRTSFWSFIRKRGVWLVILFVEEFFTQTAMRHYDAVLDAIRQAAYYMPLMLSTGGNTGSQSSTLVIRGLAVGEIKLRDWWRIFLREAGQGVVLGTVLATIAFFRVLMYPDQHLDFALTVAITLIGIAITGCTVGAMVPLVMKRFGVDPATSSTPFIASFADVLGVVVFANVAKIIMAKVIAAGHP
jgi:magnesium transporter